MSKGSIRRYPFFFALVQSELRTAEMTLECHRSASRPGCQPGRNGEIVEISSATYDRLPCLVDEGPELAHNLLDLPHGRCASIATAVNRTQLGQKRFNRNSRHRGDSFKGKELGKNLTTLQP